MTEIDIVVIGAGAAGIAAARRLGELRATCLVLEAAAVAGGRCRTDHGTLGIPVDLGAHWLHSPRRNPLIGLAAATGARIGQPLETRYSANGSWLSDEDAAACVAHVDHCFDRIAAATQDGAVADLFADATSPWHAAFLAEFAAKQGLAPEQSSILDFARYPWEGDDLPVPDGFGTLLAGLASGLNLHLATPVRRVDWSERGRLRIATDQGDIAARAVILTVSPHVLGSGIRFDPPLPDWKRDAVAALPMGHCNKLALRFERPVFGDLAPCLVMPLRGARESVEFVLREDCRDSAVCMVNGPFARELAAAGAGAMRDYVLECLVEMFGSDLRRAAAPESVFVNWDADPFFGGCYAVARPGRADMRAVLAQPVADRLFFAGEATSPEFMGDVHGAWFSGIAAAEAAAASGQ
ncbi:monoamine oxidase [Dongia mobilis]|uniref:Tryptophan 2-monooxygenase n=1 Tax=Dongia mobilis TaxID=578943 RepID=A0A4R6WUF1_9PROT|nr:NAD(P)/FAD-dependent oxidoreductase [Dongia mobilis]TDQ83293.1 monoamine oxidase [Dongia mobilis]